MVFSPDSKLLAVGGGGYGNGIVTLWDAQQPKLVQLEPSFTGEHEGLKVNVTSIAFSPVDQIQATGGSQLLATGGTDKIVNLWNISTGKLVASLEGHLAAVTSLAFSPDGKTIASGDGKGTVNLWSTTSHQLLVTLAASPDAITVVAFSADGNNLFTKDLKGEIRVWPATPREQVDRLLQPTSSINPRSIFDNRHPVGANEEQQASMLIEITQGRVQQLEYNQELRPWMWPLPFRLMARPST